MLFNRKSWNTRYQFPNPESSPLFANCNFKEDLLTYCGENETSKDFEDISESSDDNTNVVNAPRKPIVVNQDPGEKSSQGPPQIDQNCCYECGDSLDGIFCQQCICKFCGKGAHYGYNCPPKVLIISNPEQCDQTINEFPQILPNVHPTCNYEDENSFISDSKPHSFNVSPSVFNQPPQPQFETYLCELCGNNAHYGYDCSSRVPFDSVYCQEALDKILEELEEIKRDQRMLKELKKRIAEEQTAKENMSIEEMRHEQQLVDYKIKEIMNDLGYKRFRGEKIDEEYEKDCEIRIRKLKQDSNEWGSKVRKKEQAYEEEKQIHPDLPIEEPDNSLIMEDEHLDTILETESDKFIKSSVENLVQNPSESADLSDGESTDISKITRKPSKTGKHGHGERKSTKEAKDAKPKPGKGETSLKHSHWPLPTRRTHVDSEENTRGSGICSKLSAKEAQGVTITDCQAGNPCELRYDPTAHRWHPMIE
ncbi:hypothetical protein Tco_0971636 [Tanacetum coccineum]